MPLLRERLDNLPGYDKDFFPRSVESYATKCLKSDSFTDFPEGSTLAYKFFAVDRVLRNGNRGDFRHCRPDPAKSHALHQKMVERILSGHPEITRVESERILEDIAVRADSTICRFTDQYENACWTIEADGETPEQVRFWPYTSLERKLRDLDHEQRMGIYDSMYSKLTQEGELILQAIELAHPDENARERFHETKSEKDEYYMKWLMEKSPDNE